jgi:hypothetical protein
MSDFHVEDLIGVVVRDQDGRKVGRIFEMIAEERDGELVIVEYHLGKGAGLERVSMSLRNMFGITQNEPVRVSWDRLDLSNWKKPKLVEWWNGGIVE